ncbi:MAG: hypothetical protein ACYTJ0_11670 [Planctomycetota bacterium]|jgi:hypothetical protein
MLTKINVVFGVVLVASAALAALALLVATTPAATTAGLVAAGLLALVAIIGRLMRQWLAPWLESLGVLTLVAFGYGIAAGDGVTIGVGLLGTVLVGLGGAVALQLRELSPVGGRIGGRPRAERDELLELMRQMHEHVMLSDTAKRVLFRDRELELLRRVIEDDIHHRDYNAALRLCDDMANVFGYREEAETYRSRIERSRHEAYESQVHAATQELDGFLQQRDWRSAHEAAARIRRLFPEAHITEMVDNRINRAREDHKHELETSFREAAEREDVEVAMERLRQLDRYLSPEEAEELADLAHNVVAKHRDNLGMQFKLAVSDRRWADAARTGDAIIAEFPNTKMAEEVRSMIDVIRTRATQAAVSAGKG